MRGACRALGVEDDRRRARPSRSGSVDSSSAPVSHLDLFHLADLGDEDPALLSDYVADRPHHRCRRSPRWRPGPSAPTASQPRAARARQAATAAGLRSSGRAGASPAPPARPATVVRLAPADGPPVELRHDPAPAAPAARHPRPAAAGRGGAAARQPRLKDVRRIGVGIGWDSSPVGIGISDGSGPGPGRQRRARASPRSSLSPPARRAAPAWTRAALEAWEPEAGDAEPHGVLAVLDARRGEAFVAAWQGAGACSPVALTPEALVPRHQDLQSRTGPGTSWRSGSRTSISALISSRRPLSWVPPSSSPVHGVGACSSAAWPGRGGGPPHPGARYVRARPTPMPRGRRERTRAAHERGRDNQPSDLADLPQVIAMTPRLPDAPGHSHHTSTLQAPSGICLAAPRDGRLTSCPSSARATTPSGTS